MYAPVTAVGKNTKLATGNASNRVPFLFTLTLEKIMKVKTNVRAGYGGWEKY
jgi:hypothetical protein